MSLEGKQILLGVTGSIAAYKAADLCSQLGKLGARVHVVLTAHAAEFVGAATFRALTRQPVLVDLFDEPQSERIAHIELAQSADLILVAPATANILAKMAHGLADDLLSTCLLAARPATPLLVAPAMNTVMWEHPASAANLKLLESRGVQVVQPGYGLLACQDVGVGKLADTADIVSAVVDRLAPRGDYAGRRVLVTAGATREFLDPVRFLSNRSSGKMGVAIAAEAAERGARVTLVAASIAVAAPAGVEVVSAESAEAMLEACSERFPECDLFVAAAAVADYAPAEVSTRKIKKPDVAPESDVLTLRLCRTPDILATLAACKRPGQCVVGFAAETNDLASNARRKLDSKRLDGIVANDVTAAGAGFDSDTNVVTLFWPDGSFDSLPKLSKREVARRLLDALAPRLTPVTARERA